MTPRSPSKYRNRKHNGYASTREANVAGDLHVLEALGEISQLKEQVKFDLLPKQKGTLRNEREVTYTADFVYLDKEGKTHVVDVKGFKTQQYVLRRKLMKYIHGIEVEEL